MMHPDLLRAAADERIARLREEARENALHRALRAARSPSRRNRRGSPPDPGSPRAGRAPAGR
ncbi:hypothetical protein [Streptomonospora salina]|uniref:Uncharacterized protein n=1 Tax=Streptomonospora salina TaxID=104205 RepID=A0A841E8N1_9ACTN|nr:hypothetical protein [Streptomonospora salina]MBB5996880.1 hypothetical protein [Streptomonospora salina]